MPSSSSVLLAVTLGGVVGLFASAEVARAAGPYEDLRRLEEAPRPLTIPELTHPRTEAAIEETSGVVLPRSTSELRGHVPIHVMRLSVEQPVGSRQYFVGLGYGGAFGSPNDPGPMKALGSNTTLYGRAVWATNTGLTFGGGIGVILPTAHYDRSGPLLGLALAAVALRPWEISSYEDGQLAFSPFFDMRYVVGGFVFQFRQTFDGGFDVQGASIHRLSAISTAYIGFRVATRVVLGVEAVELYLIDADVPDERRTFVSISPTARLLAPHVEPWVGLIGSAGPPYSPGAESAWGARAGFTVLF